MYQNSMFVKSKMLFIDTYLVCAVISAFPAKVQKIIDIAEQGCIFTEELKIKISNKI